MIQNFIGVIEVTICNRNQANLFRSNPQRHCTSKVFNHICQCPFVAAQRGSVNDIRQLLLSVCIGVIHTEPLSQQHINLNGNKSVFLAVNILILNIQLRTIESSFVNADGVIQTEMVEDVAHNTLCFFPLFLCIPSLGP